MPVATAVVGNADHAAAVALLDMAAERRGAASMAAMTRRWSGKSRPCWATRNASPWWRKMSATSSAGRIVRATREE